MVLAELAGCITQWLEQLSDGGILGTQPDRGGWQAHFRQSGAKYALPSDERGAARRTALFAVAVGEQHALVRDAIDVGCLVAHQAARVARQVGDSDVVAPDDDDVRLLRLRFAVTHGLLACLVSVVAHAAKADMARGAVDLLRSACGG